MFALCAPIRFTPEMALKTLHKTNILYENQSKRNFILIRVLDFPGLDNNSSYMFVTKSFFFVEKHDHDTMTLTRIIPFSYANVFKSSWGHCDAPQAVMLICLVCNSYPYHPYTPSNFQSTSYFKHFQSYRPVIQIHNITLY